MKTRTRSVTLLVCSLASLAACAPPVVRLRTPKQFTVAEVRRIGWDDRCGLQGFFDQAPPPNRKLQVRTGNEGIAPAAGAPHGQITYEVAEARQRTMFQSMIRRLYGHLPAVEASDRLEVTVDFYTFCNKPRMLVDSSITVRAAGQQLRLAYHPCVGELLLNGDIYRERHTLIAGTR
jgi:hypothetical protein